MAIIYLVYQKQDDFAEDVKKILQSFNHITYDHTTVRDSVAYGTRNRNLPGDVDGTIIFPVAKGSASTYYWQEVKAAISGISDAKKIILLAPAGTSIPSDLEKYYTYFVNKEGGFRQQLAGLNDKILSNFGNLAYGFTQDYVNRVKRDGESWRYWMLCFNDRNWPMDGFGPGKDYEFNSRHRSGNTSADLQYFHAVREGDLLLGFAFGLTNAVICQFSVSYIDHIKEEDDIIIRLKVDCLIEPEILPDEIPVPNLLDDNNGQKLYPLTEEAFSQLLEGRAIRQEGSYQPTFRVDTIKQKHSLTHISNDGAGFDVQDDLDIAGDVRAMAMVVAYREVQPPLSIGLFGNWGSGKSFFMQKLEQEIRRLSLSNNERFCKEVVAIRFNSWHYSDANLWASLITRIFEGLNDFAKRHDPSQLTALYRNLHSTKELIEETELKEAQLQEEIKQLEVREQKVAAEIENKAKKLSELSYLALAKAVFKNDQVQADIAGLKKDFDFVDTQSIEALQEHARDINGFWEQVRMTFHQAYFFNFRKGLTAILLTFLVLAVCYFFFAYLPYLKRWYADVQVFITIALVLTSQILAYIRPASRVIARFNKRLNSLMNTIKQLQEEERTKHQVTVEQIRSELAAAEAAQTQLRIQHEQLLSQKTQIELELTDIRSGKKLVSFIENRISEERYANSLGIISWIRKDFEMLDFLLKQQHEAALADDQEKVENIFRIERIVLYIDDLDRCETTTVVKVLEAIHLLLAFPLFVVVVGVDPRWMNNALNQRFDKILNEEISSQAYLEKIFQIPFLLKPLNNAGIGKLIAGQFLQDADISVKEFQQVIKEHNVHIGNADLMAAPYHGTKVNLDLQTQAQVIRSARDEEASLLVISPEEVEFMQALGPMIGRTPRAVKRFVNIYRIIRSHGELVISLTRRQEHYLAVILLLALLNGYEGNIRKLFELIEQADDNRHFWYFLDSLADTEFKQLATELRNSEHAADQYLRETDMSCFQQNLTLIARFSFKLGS